MTRSCMQVFLGCLLVTGFLSLVGCNGARDTAISMLEKDRPKGFMIETINNSGRERKYGMFVPLSYDPKIKYPVIIFLHGLGEGGNDSKANLKVGLAPFVADRAGDFPFIVLFPQSPNGSWGEDSEQASDVIAILDEVSRKYSVDQDRVSLTGLSTGGYGTWAIGAKHKDRFAALVPMGSSASATKYCEQLVNMPIRSYHNNGDWAAAMWNDTSMVDRINMLGGHAEMFKTDGSGHNCWEIAYGETDMLEWLLTQRRRPMAAASGMGTR
jgi:predicted peptidase